VSEIEISEADEQRFERLSSRLVECFSTQSVKYAVEEQRRIWLEELASHRLAATAAGESRVAEAVKAERARIKKIVCDYALSIHDPYDVSAAWALENVARMLRPTPEANQ